MPSGNNIFIQAKAWAGMGYELYIIDFTNGVEQKISKSIKKIFPNTATNSLKLSGFELENGKPIYISDVMGRTVFKTVNTEEINLESIPPGSYWLKVGNDLMRFVKE